MYALLILANNPKINSNSTRRCDCISHLAVLARTHKFTRNADKFTASKQAYGLQSVVKFCEKSDSLFVTVVRVSTSEFLVRDSIFSPFHSTFSYINFLISCHQSHDNKRAPFINAQRQDRKLQNLCLSPVRARFAK